MKKRVKQLLCIALVLVFALCIIPKQADASKPEPGDDVYKISIWKQNTYATGKQDYTDNDTMNYIFHLQKITVPANGYVTIQAATKDEIWLIRSLDRNTDMNTNQTNNIMNNTFPVLSDSKKYNIVLHKGTWYVHLPAGKKAKWTFTKAKNPTNLYRSKATRLTAGKSKTIFINYGYEAPLWYKIVLPKKKTLTVSFKNLDPCVVLYNSKLECVWRDMYVTSSRTGVLPKGTYYLQVSTSANDDPFGLYGRIGSITWR